MNGRFPYFLFLLPVFFVFHGFVAHSQLVRWMDAARILTIFLLATTVLWLAARRLLKNDIRAALVVFLLLLCYLFFGNIRDLFRGSRIFLYHYGLLLPLLLVAVILLTRSIIRNPPPARLTRYLNLIFLLFILADGARWAMMVDKNPITASTTLPTGRCDTCPHPDIYLLLFDEYAGSRTLLNTFHYDDSALDGFLRSETFHILPDSRSNYSATPFSMASLLNLAYLQGLEHPGSLEPADYANVFTPIANNEATRFLAAQGYSIFNYSPFDLAGHPAQDHVSFFPSGTSLITYRNFPDCMIRDFPALAPSGKNAVARSYRLNETELNETILASARTGGHPKFVYMHVMMPHEPFLFDSLFHRRDIRTVQSTAPKLADYLGYLPYTNARIRRLITAVKKNTGGKAVILFMSDHGFRYWPGNTPDSVYFRNQNAVYLPNGDYSGFYDSMSNVNQFRVVFNKLFSLDLPLLPDSTVLLLDKPN